ncbi:MAG: hypothetical protein A49_07190 [Methyloceanibacter sp.]|nr:MAG: hypothetical protein A49_07190 [Methyloceanibacter sp.]
MKNNAPPKEADQQRLPEVRLKDEEQREYGIEQDRQLEPRHVLPLLTFVEQPRREHDEGRLHELGRLQRERAELEPALGTLHLRTDKQNPDHQGDADHEDDEARASYLLRRQGRDREHDREGRNEHPDMAANEVELIQSELLGDGRARRERQHDARPHQQQQGDQHQPVDGKPPIGEDASVCTRDPHGTLILYRDALALQHEFPERIAALGEVGILIEGGTGRRQ